MDSIVRYDISELIGDVVFVINVRAAAYATGASVRHATKTYTGQICRCVVMLVKLTRCDTQ